MKAPKASVPALKKRVIIVDDHPMTRDGLVHLVDGEPDLIVVLQASTASQAFNAVCADPPDLLISDFTLPDKTGAELVKDVKAVHPRVPVLVLSMHDESLYAERVLRAGASGYVMKTSGSDTIMKAIRKVLSGEIHVSEAISARILRSMAGAGTGGGPRSPVEHLSDREFDVFRLIGNGSTTVEVAERLHISAKTVEAHRVNIKAKLGLGSAAELIAYAAKWISTEGAG